jgi:hypothetical protein
MKRLFLLFLIGTTFSLFAQTTPKQESIKNDTITEIIDPVENMPFSIERDSVYTKTPDSLGVNQKGFAVLGLLINDKSKIEEVQILRLYLTENDNVLVDYTIDLDNSENKNISDKRIQKYYQFLKEYTKTVRIIKTSQKVPKLTKMSIIVRFR